MKLQIHAAPNGALGGLIKRRKFVSHASVIEEGECVNYCLQQALRPSERSVGDSDQPVTGKNPFAVKTGVTTFDQLRAHGFRAKKP